MPDIESKIAKQWFSPDDMNSGNATTENGGNSGGLTTINNGAPVTSTEGAPTSGGNTQSPQENG